jgi:hypothetical protein
VDGQVGALGEVLAQESVGVLTGATLPRRVGVTDVDVDVRGDTGFFARVHLDAVISGE